MWSRIYVEQRRLKPDLGRSRVVEVPSEEVETRWGITTLQRPIMNAVLLGLTRDQMMARHKANHIQVAMPRGSDRLSKHSKPSLHSSGPLALTCSFVERCLNEFNVRARSTPTVRR